MISNIADHHVNLNASHDYFAEIRVRTESITARSLNEFIEYTEYGSDHSRNIRKFAFREPKIRHLLRKLAEVDVDFNVTISKFAFLPSVNDAFFSENADLALGPS